MLEPKTISLFTTAVATVTAGGAINTGPVAIAFYGIVIPVIPVAIGMLSALLVRIIVITSGRKRLWTYNLAVTALSMLGAATFIADHSFGPGGAFWAGTSFGAAGVAIVEMARSRFMDAFKEGAYSFLSAFTTKRDGK